VNTDPLLHTLLISLLLLVWSSPAHGAFTGTLNTLARVQGMFDESLDTASTAIPGSIESEVGGYVPHRARASGQFGEGIVSSTLSVSAMAMDDVEWGSAEATVSYRATNPTSQPLGCYFDFTLPAGYVGAGASEVGSSAGLQLGAYRRGPSGVQGYLFEVRLPTTGRQGIDPGAEEYTSDHSIYGLDESLFTFSADGWGWRLTSASFSLFLGDLQPGERVDLSAWLVLEQSNAFGSARDFSTTLRLVPEPGASSAAVALALLAAGLCRRTARPPHR
jgi:hypothetical protein